MMNAIGNIDDRYVMEFAEVTSLKKTDSPVVKWILPLAACLCAACLGLVLWVVSREKTPAGDPQIIAPSGTTTSSAPNNTTVPTTAVPPTTTGWEVVELLVYKPANGDLGMNSTFFEDENNVYYFYERESKYVYVRYSNGTTENITEAFRSGKVTIADLDRLEIEYGVSPKNSEEMP